MRVVVWDNASTDDSVPELRHWLDERLISQKMADEPNAWGWVPVHTEGAVHSVHLLRFSQNLGYAGGLNAGIDWARRRWMLDGFWLLNNDVQAQPGALDALVSAQRSTPRAGICGSVLLDWDYPERVQAMAGSYRPWLGVGWHATNLPVEDGGICLALDYPVGASMYVAMEYLDKVGPMDASYFLYCEEMDWAERGRRQGYRPVVAINSRLRHKEGASTDSRGGVRNKSLLSERYGVISRLRITRKLWPHWLPVVWASLVLVILDRLLHGEMARAWLVTRLMLTPSLWLRNL